MNVVHFRELEDYMDDKVQFVVTAADWDDNFDQVRHINPFTLRMAKNRPYNSGNIYQTKAFFGKCLKEKCYLEVRQQLSFKFFVTCGFITSYFQKYESSRQYFLEKL